VGVTIYIPGRQRRCDRRRGGTERHRFHRHWQ
jgi:hypothetical protein